MKKYPLELFELFVSFFNVLFGGKIAPLNFLNFLNFLTFCHFNRKMKCKAKKFKKFKGQKVEKVQGATRESSLKNSRKSSEKFLGSTSTKKQAFDFPSKNLRVTYTSFF